MTFDFIGAFSYATLAFGVTLRWHEAAELTLDELGKPNRGRA
jgi:hypothetical protein